MPDPIRDLENLGSGGMPVHPLSPSEVRRRGDRLRRRRHAVTAAVAAAAAAAVVGTTAVLAGGTSDRTDPPGPIDSPTATSTGETTAPAGPVRTRIPDEFPIDLDVQPQEDGTTPGPSRGELGLQIPAPCGVSTTQYDGFEDQLGVRAEYPAGGSDGRTLRTFEAVANAEEAMAMLRSAANDCPEEPIGSDGDGSYVWTVRDLALGDESFTLVQTFDLGLGGAIFQFVRVGNAILVTEAGGEWELTSTVPVGIRERTAIATEIADAMCVFAADPCGGPATEQGTASVEPAPVQGDDDIPDGFPLDVDHEDLTGSGGSVVGPESGIRGIETAPCGRPVWSVPARDRLAFTSTGPDHADVRELRTFADAQDAVAQMSALRRLLGTCREEPVDGAGMRTWRTYEADTGYETFAFGSMYTQGSGGDITVAVRVGRAVLIVTQAGENSPWTQEDLAPDVVSLARTITADMCAFTEAGCD